MTDVDHGKHYRYEYRGIKLDPARICVIYDVHHPMQINILKKSLRAGSSIKDLRQDINDMICSCNRWLEMIEEDEKMTEEKK